MEKIKDGKVMGPDYGKYFCSPRGRMWAVEICSWDYEGIRTFDVIDYYREKEEAVRVANELNMENYGG